MKKFGGIDPTKFSENLDELITYLKNKCNNDLIVFYKNENKIIFEKDKAISLIQYCKTVAELAQRQDKTLDVYKGYYIYKNKGVYQSTKHYFNVKDGIVHEFKFVMGNTINESDFICYIGYKIK